MKLNPQDAENLGKYHALDTANGSEPKLASKDSAIRSDSFWLSIARICATGAIFMFHYLDLLGLYTFRLDFYAILIFCFLSGYLVNLPNSGRLQWATKRLLGVLVPYWLVIIPVIIANEIVGYKEITVAEYMVTAMGGNLFLQNPLYVPAWYVTFILILYAYALLESFCDLYWTIICMIIGAFVLEISLNLGEYFVAFLVGLRVSPTAKGRRTEVKGKLANSLFAVQKYCYPFFLVHGAALLLIVKYSSASPGAILIAALILSLVLAIILHAISNPLQDMMGKRITALVSMQLGVR